MKDNSSRFAIWMQKKLVILFFGILLAFGVLSAILVSIAKENGTEYQKQVLSQQRYDSTTIPFRRGDIVDARGTQLATSEKVYNLIIDASVMTSSKGKYLEDSLQALAQYFPQLNMTEIRQYVSTHESSQWYVALRRLTYDEISDFRAAQAEGNIKGVWFEEEYRRIYPNGSLAADVIGFANSSNEGSYGLEEYYNSVLNGTNGREYGYLNDDSNLERTVKPAVDGYTIHSTIDANIQSIVEKYLKQFNDERMNVAREGNGAENIGCIIMEVDTGRILAMANYPTYDLNNVRDPAALIGSNLYEREDLENGYYRFNKTDTIITQEILDDMSEDQLYVNLNNLWKNFCITSTYEPGSTAKPFTVAAALENGDITGNEHYGCSGYYEVGGHEIGCHPTTGGHGDVTVQSSVAWSCNIALIKIGQTMGRESFSKFQNIFNFGLKTNVDLAGEARTASLIYEAGEMGPADLATNSFGQNFNVTMIQMITGFCSLINGGYYYEPHMVDRITNSSGATIENIEPRVLKQTVSESTSALIRQYCRATVMEEGGEHRTGQTARPAGYAIGGKTGTAETYPRDNNEYVVSFIGFAPADDPQIAIYVVVDRANATKQDDAKYATGIVRNILTEVLPYLNIFMTEELSEKEIQELNERHLAITNMYTLNPEEEPSEEGAENGGTPEESGYDNGDGTITDPTGETVNKTPPWMNYPIDPTTGYRKDPNTGNWLDAQTGELIDKSESAMGADVPVNPHIINPMVE